MNFKDEIAHLRVLLPLREGDWQEQDHPRAEGGRFGTKSGDAGEEKKATANDLPEDPWRYFTRPPGTVLIKVDQLQTIRARPDGIANAAKHLANAYNGDSERRKPISVKKNPDGTYTVLDGNNTPAIAKNQKWKELPVTIEEGRQLRELMWELAEETLGEDFKPGTIRKWRTGTVIKMRDGSWVPYQGAAQAKQALPAPKSVADLDRQVKMAGALLGVSELQRLRKLPKDHTPEEHRKIADKFLKAHAASLPAALERVQEVVVGNGTVVSGRVKDIESALGKLVRKPKYKTTAGLKDGTGMRVICESVDDALATVAALKKRFKNSAADEEDYITKPKDGYRSYHLVVEDDDGLWKEIQIRTPNQDTWANWCHDIYKPQNEEQESAVQASKDEILEYGKQMSDYYFERDNGKSPPKPPECPPVVQKSPFGCLPA